MNILFVAYQPASDPLMISQGFSYLRNLYSSDIRYSLLTYETKDSIKNSKEYISGLNIPLGWNYLFYHRKPRFLSKLFDIVAGIFLILLLIRKNKVDIVHARGFIPAVISYIPVKLFKVKFFFDTRGLLADKYVGGNLLSADSFLYKAMRWSEDALLKVSDFFTVETDRHAEVIRHSYGSICNKMEVIPCCVDMEKFDYLTYSRHNSQRNFTLVYLGKAGTWYLFDEMLDFFKVFERYIPQSSFIVFMGSDHGDIRSLASKKNINDQYFSVIKPDNDRIPALLSESNAGIFFINPYKRYNSSPVKFGEYLASGLPVIVNAGIGDCDDVIRNERVGVVVNEFSERGYKSACEQLVQLLSEGEMLKKRCRKAAEKYFSLELGVSRYKDIYKVLYSDRL